MLGDKVNALGDIIKVNEKDYILENIEIIKNHLVFTIKEVL